MILRDVTVLASPKYERRRDFNLETHCVSSLFLQYLPDVDCGPFGKIIVQVTEGGLPERAIEELTDVAIAHKRFSFDRYWGAKEGERKRQVLDVLNSGLCDIAKQNEWPLEPFLETYERVLDNGIKNAGFWKKPVPSPDGTLTAQVFYSHDLREAKVFVVFRDRHDSELERMAVTSVPPHHMYLAPVLGKLEWISDNKVSLASRDKKDRWELEVPVDTDRKGGPNTG